MNMPMGSVAVGMGNMPVQMGNMPLNPVSNSLLGVNMGSNY
jgi:hypothetical protein